MRALIADGSSAGRALSDLLAAAGCDVSPWPASAVTPCDLAVLAIAAAADLELVRDLNRRLPGVPVVVLSRVALPDAARAQELGLTVMFPGFPARRPGGDPKQAPSSLALPGCAVGPPLGAVRSRDRWVAAALRSAGIRVSCRGDMQSWLTVASACLGPLRGAVVAAARQGLGLRDAPDLVTVATLAARERLRVLRSAGFALDARWRCLLALPERCAIRVVRRTAERLQRAADLPCLPTVAEAVVVRQRLSAAVARAGAHTPAADFLDLFCAEEVERGHVGGSEPDATQAGA